MARNKVRRFSGSLDPAWLGPKPLSAMSRSVRLADCSSRFRSTSTDSCFSMLWLRLSEVSRVLALRVSARARVYVSPRSRRDMFRRASLEEGDRVNGTGNLKAWREMVKASMAPWRERLTREGWSLNVGSAAANSPSLTP